MSFKYLTLALGTFALLGCDSGLAYRADLGQDPSKLPAVTAQIRTPPAPLTLQTLTFVGTAQPLPADWVTAQNVKVLVAGSFLPMIASGSTGAIAAASSLTATIQPGTVTPPLNGSAATMSFLVNNDHVMVATVTFQ